jgi:glyoxylase-like metal-dependent hydrolase (beta-lactamase superfamily II)
LRPIDGGAAVLVQRQIDRRTFLAGLGHGAFAIAIVSVVGCAPSDVVTTPPPSQAASAGTGSTPTGGPAGTPGGAPAGTPPGESSPGTGQGVAWERVNLGFVSAYLLVRGGEAAIVDTGVGGSEGDIEASLAALNLGWADVGHVILTHRHGDHAGSIAAILGAAPNAAAYAGAEDLAAIATPRPLTAVGDGDTVFDLRIVTSPGHTAGSISVLDPAAGVLVVGDAMGTSGGRPTLPGAQFTEDMDVAKQSVAKLGGFSFETLLVGHGNPIESGADALVAALGANG